MTPPPAPSAHEGAALVFRVAGRRRIEQITGMAFLEPGRAREILDRLPSPVGYGMLAVGVALLVLPGPGIPFVLGGLAVLARRRPWARRARRRLRLHLARGLGRRGRRGPRPAR